MRLVDADMVYQETMKYSEKTRKMILSVIDNLPTVERKTGHWVNGGDPISWICSSCGYVSLRYIKTPFCHNCGADMRESEVTE